MVPFALATGGMIEIIIMMLLNDILIIYSLRRVTAVVGTAPRPARSAAAGRGWRAARLVAALTGIGPRPLAPRSAPDGDDHHGDDGRREQQGGRFPEDEDRERHPREDADRPPNVAGETALESHGQTLRASRRPRYCRGWTSGSSCDRSWRPSRSPTAPARSRPRASPSCGCGRTASWPAGSRPPRPRSRSRSGSPSGSGSCPRPCATRPSPRWRSRRSRACIPGRFHAGLGHGADAWMRQIGVKPASQLALLEETRRRGARPARGRHRLRRGPLRAPARGRARPPARAAAAGVGRRPRAALARAVRPRGRRHRAGLALHARVRALGARADRCRPRGRGADGRAPADRLHLRRDRSRGGLRAGARGAPRPGRRRRRVPRRALPGSLR